MTRLPRRVQSPLFGLPPQHLLQALDGHRARPPRREGPNHADSHRPGIDSREMGTNHTVTTSPALVDNAVRVNEKVVANVVPAVALHMQHPDAADHCGPVARRIRASRMVYHQMAHIRVYCNLLGRALRAAAPTRPCDNGGRSSRAPSRFQPGLPIARLDKQHPHRPSGQQLYKANPLIKPDQAPALMAKIHFTPFSPDDAILRPAQPGCSGVPTHQPQAAKQSPGFHSPRHCFWPKDHLPNQALRPASTARQQYQYHHPHKCRIVGNVLFLPVQSLNRAASQLCFQFGQGS